MTAVAGAERYYSSADGLRLFYRDFAPLSEPARLPVLCLPGLTRNSRDFTHVAERIRRDRRVLCADLRGRGRSQHDPAWQNYHPGTYLADIGLLLQDAGIARCVLLGTSLGGILSMLLAATNPGLVAGVILNDVGPEVEPEGLARIASYVGRAAPPATWDEAIVTVRATYEIGMPGLSHEQWAAYARRSYSDVDGKPKLDMDPMIGEAVRSAPAAAAPDLWGLYAGLQPVPTLALRGATSDILSTATFARMQREKPDLVRVEVPDRGHTPQLDEPAAVAAIDAFLARTP
ncbi:MAG TPA: alpha/beta hydrolase [Burkholderiaceae bacterium]|nr:alpha/beta hydrolase [Burkholderiaceae bacterium]